MIQNGILSEEEKTKVLWPTQSLLLKIGQSGCLFLSLVHACDLEDKIYRIAIHAIASKAMTPECYILDHNKLAKCITEMADGKFRLEFVGTFSQYASGCINIGSFRNKGTTHFVLMGPSGVLYDPILNSKTVQLGSLVDYRRYKLWNL